MSRLLSPWSALKLTVGVIYIFLMAPILITAVVSFNASNRSQFPPQGWSLRWWKLALSPEWIDPLLFSLKLASTTAVLSALMALPLAFALVRYRFPGRSVLLGMALGPLLLPALVTGVAILQFFDTMGWRQFIGFPSLLAGHLVICLPFAVRTIAISLHTLPPNLELAAASLGASPRATLFGVTLPFIKNGIVVGGLFAFIHSFTDINLSLFLVRPGVQPVTVKIIGFLEFGFAPTLAAVSVITLIVPLVLVVVLERVTGLGDFIYGGRGNG